MRTVKPYVEIDQNKNKDANRNSNVANKQTYGKALDKKDD